MNNAEQDPFESIIDLMPDVGSLQDESAESGRLVYSPKIHKYPGDYLSNKSDGFGHYWMRFPNRRVLYTCTPLEQNFRLPPHWVSEFNLTKMTDRQLKQTLKEEQQESNN